MVVVILMLRIVIVVIKLSVSIQIIIVMSNRILLVNLGQDFKILGLSRAWDFRR